MKAFTKGIRRSITHSRSRFWAIFGIVALGAGFFAGLRSTAPDMRATGDAYYDSGNMMDIHILSTLGLTEDDVAAVRAAADVSGVEPAYTADIISKLSGMDRVIRVQSLPSKSDSGINRPRLDSGRWPQSPGECVVGAKRADQLDIKIGDTLQVSAQNGSQRDMLKYGSYKIVGLVSNSYYISFNLGTTDIGNGDLSYFMYIRPEDFDSPVYTDLFATVSGAKELNSLTDRYTDTVTPVTDTLKKLAPSREEARYQSLYQEAKQKLDAGREEYRRNKADAEQKLSDSAAALAKGEQEMTANEKKLNDAAGQIASGETALKDGESTLNAKSAELAAAKKRIAAAQEQLDSAQKQWEQGKAQLAAQTAETNARLQQAEAAIGSGLPGAPATRQEYEQIKAAAEQQLKSAQAQLDAAKAKTDAGTRELTLQSQQLAAGENRLAAARNQLTQKQAELRSAKRSYTSGQKQLAQAKADLANGRTEYEAGKADADTKLANAEKKLTDGQTELNTLKKPQWYVLTRDSNPGFASFRSDADRMDSISTVFPLIFFMVAALVALTSMTRMVEEERVQIGTYKALGFSNGKIALKYLSYAALAGISGSVTGISIGMWVLPQVVWNAYGILYSAPPLRFLPNLGHALTAMGAAVGCTLFATYAACRAELAETPANLMLPRAPKPGKRILLEKITPLWSRMNFTQKVTARNLFRYKKRLLMTVIGIAGCTALLVTGFGLRNAVSQILTKQFDEIDIYNATVGLKQQEVDPGLKSILDDKNNFSDWMAASARSADITVGGKTASATLFVPETAQQLKKFITLRDRVSGADVPFGKDSVVLTEKLAKQLGVKAGDEVRVKSGDYPEVTLHVTGITENYVYHYLYIDPALYESAMGSAPQFNEVETKLANSDGAHKSALTEKLMAQNSVGTFSVTRETMDRYGNMMKSVNMIVVVLIVSASMLAFIVLYNLTNINITERQRELATIKVLGFFDNEVSAYIYRETFLLTVIGCAAGLLLGILMCSFVVQTTEVDFIMFGRTIEPLSYVWSAGLTLLFSGFVNAVMYRKLKKIDMVESLKSVE